MTAKKFLYLRTTLAFLLVPLAAPLFGVGIDYSVHEGPSPAGEALQNVILVSVLAYGGTIFFGVPACPFLVWLRWTTLVHAALAGFLIGVTLHILFIATMIDALTVRTKSLFRAVVKVVTNNPDVPFVWGGAGALIAIIIWFVAKGPRHFHSRVA
jgi:hypothetical protein